MAENESAPEEGFWLDLSVHRRVHRRLTTWGKRLGLTAEGFAKLLIYQGMHSLLAEEVGKRSRVPRATDQLGRPADSSDEIARTLWLAMLKPYNNTPDLLPAPRHVADGHRKYHADDFNWPDGKRPPRDEVYWDGANLSLA